VSEREGKNKKEKREEYDQNIKNIKGPRLRYERKWTEKKVRGGTIWEERDTKKDFRSIYSHLF